MSIDVVHLAGSLNQAFTLAQNTQHTNKEELDDLFSTAPRTDRMYYGMKLIIQEKCL